MKGDYLDNVDPDTNHFNLLYPDLRNGESNKYYTYSDFNDNVPVNE